MNDHTYSETPPEYDTDELPRYPEGPYSNQRKSNKFCFVPKCKNTLFNSEKLFIFVPYDIKARKQWFEKARRPYNVSDKSTLYACQDHFDVENDIDNFLALKMGFESRIRLKPNVLPRYFNCQVDRPLAHSSKPRPLLEKKRKLEIIENSMKRSTPDQSRSSISSIPEPVLPEISQDELTSIIQCENPLKDVGTQTLLLTTVPLCSTKDVGIQFNVNKTFGRSKKVTTDSIKKKDQATSTPEQLRKKVFPLIYTSSSSESDSEPISTEFDLNSTVVSECTLPPMINENKILRQRDNTIDMIEEKPLNFIGVPKESMHVCDKLAHFLKLEIIFIYIVLVKIRLDLPYEIMSSFFGYSSSHIARCFNNNIRGVAKLMSGLVYWPSADIVRYNLPVAYRHHFKNVYCIIDCLEIEIHKPSDAKLQAASWSEYKKGNTAKYLIACTPQGFINFVSVGFGGRITDAKILEKSGFLENLKPEMDVMADRGFKNLDAMFTSRGCKLIRPPSVYVALKPSKEEVKQTKRIASLRVIIENVIGRVRHYKFLDPHAGIHIKKKY